MEPKSMDIQTFFDPATSTFSHLVWDPDTLDAAIVDPVLDYDPKSGRTTTDNADKVIDAMSAKQLKLRYILETHAHADHLTAAPYLKSRCGGQIAIGAKIRQVQEVFRGIFNLRDLATDGSQFDVLLTEGDTLSLGSLSIEVLDTPGHTPACISYRIDDAIFIGDTFFSPGYGTARADFPGGNAEALYNSLQRLLSYPDGTRLYLCHD
ncbi:MAG TPA: MBL fold metallo-hydrolase, partial [Porticoccaceae bacterium]|nr:MBL fold metallo-hydrolase [Porticoccaceae bacterium]